MIENASKIQGFIAVIMASQPNNTKKSVADRSLAASILCNGDRTRFYNMLETEAVRFLESEMEIMKLRSHIGTDGILLLQMPTDFKDTSVDVVVVVQPLSSGETKPQYNAWGKLTTKKSIQEAIARMRELRQEVALDKSSIREMIEEGRRF